MQENNTKSFEGKSVYKEIDETIISLCEDIRKLDVKKCKNYSDNVCALAELISAKAAIMRALL